MCSISVITNRYTRTVQNAVTKQPVLEGFLRLSWSSGSATVDAVHKRAALHVTVYRLSVGRSVGPRVAVTF